MAPVAGHRRAGSGAAALEAGGRSNGRPGVPDATVGRLPLYHRVLTALLEQGIATVSSDGLAEAAGVSSAKLRKDLSHLGSYGTRGVGYDVAHLLDQIGRELGLSQDWPVVVVGVGNLGHALANYGGFASRGFRLVALFDADPRRIGEVVAGLPVRSVGDLAGALAETGALIAVVATPADAAQGVCDTLVASGVRSILNFAPAVLSVPAGVEVRKVDLASELQILTFHEQRKSAGPAAAAASVARSTVGVGG